jgi:hypothetical protein
MKSKVAGYFLIIFAIAGQRISLAQQDHTLYLMHCLPESNLINPAVPISCKWYIGLPVLSSVHLNYANSSFSYNTLFNKTGNGIYETDVNKAIKSLHLRNFISTELHIQLFALGYRRDDYSFVFTITEKNNLSVTYPKKPVMLLWGGNFQFAGESAGFKGSGLYFTHYREYALNASKHLGDGKYFGVRAKLLFGKLNFSSRSTTLNLFTNGTFYDLTLDGEVSANSSLPIVVDAANNQLNSISVSDNINPLQLALNRKNPGFAIDAGIVYPYSDKIELSASVIDLGFIRWRSNLNDIKASGNFTYKGPISDSVPTETYINDLMNSFSDSMHFDVSQKKYTTFLPTRILAGASYQINPWLLTGIQGEAIFYRTKIIPSFTLTAQAEPINNIRIIASYSLQYYDPKCLGLGLVLGRNPVQFYIISDDVPAMIWPLSARNINLRFGLNINLGCRIKEPSKGGSGKGMLQGNCYWLEKSIQKRYQKLKKKK